jgi:hypothetical protein
MAERLLAMLDELGEALQLHSTNFAPGDRDMAQKTYDKWNRSLVKHTERDAMFQELGLALNRRFGVPASYAISPQALSVPWAKNLHDTTTDSAIKVPLDDKTVSELTKRGAITTPEDLARSGAKYLRIAGMTMDQTTHDLLLEKEVEAVILIKCEYPSDWDNPFPSMSLRRLVIFGGNQSQPPEDRFRGMSNTPIETLELVMADFMLVQECMDQLVNMPNLVILNVARTVTTEKVRKLGAKVDELVDALLAVIARGTLRELNIVYCSAIPLAGIKRLAAALAKNDGRLVVGGETQLKLLNLQ